MWGDGLRDTFCRQPARKSCAAWWPLGNRNDTSRTDGIQPRRRLEHHSFRDGLALSVARDRGQLVRYAVCHSLAPQLRAPGRSPD